MPDDNEEEHWFINSIYIDTIFSDFCGFADGIRYGHEELSSEILNGEALADELDKHYDNMVTGIISMLKDSEEEQKEQEEKLEEIKKELERIKKLPSIEEKLDLTLEIEYLKEQQEKSNKYIQELRDITLVNELEKKINEMEKEIWSHEDRYKKLEEDYKELKKEHEETIRARDYYKELAENGLPD